MSKKTNTYRRKVHRFTFLAIIVVGGLLFFGLDHFFHHLVWGLLMEPVLHEALAVVE